MKLVVGAPVCDRDWALPYWMSCLARQTRPPDEYCFVVNDVTGNTRRLLHELAPVYVPQLSYAIDRTQYIPRQARNSHDGKHVYGDFAARRNRLLQMVLKREPDAFLSLDTDIMLEDSTVIERLLELLSDAPVAAPCTFMHAAGRESECFNAGFWGTSDIGSPERAWKRVTAEEADGVLEIDIPMAAVMMRREVAESCEYAYHAQGEDLGFAQDLDAGGFSCLWDADLEVRHVMSPEAL